MELKSPLWLSALLALPLVWGLFFLYYRGEQPLHQLEKFIDKHLIPYLLVGGEKKKQKLWITLLFWTLVYSCLVLALAGPRWDFREIPAFTRDQSLAVLLDLSESMNAKDVSPSRLGRAKQKIEDILNMSKGAKIGLIAFAADPHMIAPLTEDKEAIRHLLPTLDTDLVYVQGSKLASALEMAAAMLDNEPGNNKAILVISDGGFEDTSALHTAKKLADKGIVIHTMGVGTLEGGPLKVKKNGSSVISKLEKEKFQEISKMGRGSYFDAGHSDKIALLFERSDVQKEAQKNERIWEEHFYLFLLPVLPFFLLWYRRGYIFIFLFLQPAHALSYFYNTEQQAAFCFENGDYAAAAAGFQDPYRKGVAYYRMEDYAAAEEMFRKSERSDYNLGNALAKQNKLQEAIKAYEAALEKTPDHIQAKENLELVKKMLEEQKQDEQKQEEQKQEQNQEQEQQEQQDEKEGEQEQHEQPRSQEDQDADLWLDQMKNDPKTFLKNKFYLESKQNGTKEEVDPW